MSTTIAQMINALPPHLAERVSEQALPAASALPMSDGKFVLYWMRTAMRFEENPALDVARFAAHQLNLPLLVYQGLSQRYPYASDRHHAFIMQGVRDLQQSAKQFEISYAFHLERPGAEDDYLRQLAVTSALVITEDMPTAPPRVFLRALRVKEPTPVLLTVDTACVAPMRLVGKAFDRAFAFRSKTKDLYRQRVGRRWPEFEFSVEPFNKDELPFSPVDLHSASIEDLIAECAIDHSVWPVVDTLGGGRAGYQRWDQFLASGLKGYARNRNNALLDGVSRMSAYLHYGMVSPMRLAREVAARDEAGSEKYLDELLIWRELAYCFCRFRADHGRWSALPAWARQTLEEHQADSRPRLYSWEELARGNTEDELWNAAQKSLLIHGELHNNLRMTWGKALLNWTRSPRTALKRIIDLNHRFALDGRDPASYGGILWCLGQFDRPFAPAQAIFGTVRTRPLSVHAQRLDPIKYAALSSVSRAHPKPTVAVIGAGMAGSLAARTLADAGLSVTVFEKSRGAGGRMATRRTDFGRFDHGAQYFTARDAGFRRLVRSWVDQQLVREWNARIVSFDGPTSFDVRARSTQRFVGVPGMNAIPKHLIHGAVARGANLHVETQVEGLQKAGSQWLLRDADGHELGAFDRVLVSAPAAQSARILACDDELHSQLLQLPMNPCWAVMLSLEKPLSTDWDAAFVNFGLLRWIARNRTKPGRESSLETVTLHANPEWSRENLKQPQDWIAQQLFDEFQRVTGLAIDTPVHLEAHRWRYSIPLKAASRRCLVNRDGTLLACGDWAAEPRVEGAFLSGAAAAGRILGKLSCTSKPGEQLMLDLNH
ncbi:MAG: FAD-dependent oxidoreductase [bacterium]|nr:FAD-dependent oxidoreductase [bacterium]